MRRRRERERGQRLRESEKEREKEGWNYFFFRQTTLSEDCPRGTCMYEIKLAEGEKRRPLSLGRDRNESRDLGGAGDWPPLRREKDRQLFSTVFPYIERRTCPYD